MNFLWPIEFVEWWFSESLPWFIGILPLVIGAVGGVFAGTWRFAKSHNPSELGAGFLVGAVVGVGGFLLGPLVVVVLWFGWPIIGLWYGFYRFARRVQQVDNLPVDPALDAAYRELEREGL